jgi:hypothetical protein
MHSAGSEDGNGIDILSSQEIVDFVGRGYTEFGREGIGTGTDGIAYRHETRPVDMVAAQQLGVTLCNTATSEQAKSNHDIPLDSGNEFAYGWQQPRYGSETVPYPVKALLINADYPQRRCKSWLR